MEVSNGNVIDSDSKSILKLRRVKSSTRVSDIKDEEKRERMTQPDNPCHHPKDSLFSFSSGFHNYRGLLNLCIILLVLSNARVALENVMKYGILVDPLQWIKVFIGNPSNWPSCQLVLTANIFILISYAIEKYCLASGLFTELIGRIFVILNVIAILLLPPIVIQSASCHPIGASFACGIYSIITLKLVSYHMVNYWCRLNCFKCSKLSNGTFQLRRRSLTVKDLKSLADDYANSNDDSPNKFVVYPENLHLKDIYYFIFAPTLCYELNFPRSERIRKRFLIKRIIEMIFLLQLNLGLIQQWIVPTISNSIKPLVEMHYSMIIERLLKLSVPNHIIWLIFFYWYFHSFLNILAEVLRFADREFYRDWWNAESVDYFWQNWNIPVHKWCVRHLYKPMINRKFSRFQSSVSVFLLSAFFHEYLVSVPLSMFRMWAFFGMLSQIPFSFFVAKYLNRQYANIAVWISIIIGQPLCILMYYHDYYVINYVTKSN